MPAYGRGVTVVHTASIQFPSALTLHAFAHLDPTSCYLLCKKLVARKARAETETDLYISVESIQVRNIKLLVFSHSTTLLYIRIY